MKLFKCLPLLLCLMMMGCKDVQPNSNRNLTLEYYKSYANEAYSINSHAIRRMVDSLMRNDPDRHTADLHTRHYYQHEGDFIWITRHGVDHRADTLLCFLRSVTEMGFNKRRFMVDEIGEDLQKLRTLQLDEDQGQINKVMARLEYRLTKSYFRYVVGQRFGYMNPNFVLNRLDTLQANPYDTIRRPVRYRGLFDVRMDHPGNYFYEVAIRKVRVDSISSFLHEVQPHNPFYKTLMAKLANPNLGKKMRAKILVNMERCRWREADNPWQYKKYVVVNIPSFHLMGVDHEDTLTMRIGCGANKTKTPLLTSRFKRMDINPQWFMPRSIVIHDIIHHVGSRSYFQSRNYYVRENSTGKEVDPGNVTRAMLLSGAYGVAQRGGKGNALGRIIFRFDNNFAVFLHDTNSRGVFGREDRGVSHGCVRVEKPYDFAVFLLAEKNQKLMDKIQYSMTADSLSEKSRVIGSVKLEPQVPLFITYYTLYPMAGGRMEEYPDVYGYDRVIFNEIKKYL